MNFDVLSVLHGEQQESDDEGIEVA